jgi:hypothetical protein
MVYSDPSTLGEPDLHSTTQVPVVATETRKVALESEDGNYSATGEIVSSQTISSKTRTVETITVCSLFIIITFKVYLAFKLMKMVKIVMFPVFSSAWFISHSYQLFWLTFFVVVLILVEWLIPQFGHFSHEQQFLCYPEFLYCIQIQDTCQYDG